MASSPYLTFSLSSLVIHALMMVVKYNRKFGKKQCVFSPKQLSHRRQTISSLIQLFRDDFEIITLSLLFLDASSHLYKRVCPSVHPSIGPSVTRFFEILLSAIFSRVKGVDGVQMGEDAFIGA